LRETSLKRIKVTQLFQRCLLVVVLIKALTKSLRHAVVTNQFVVKLAQKRGSMTANVVTIASALSVSVVPALKLSFNANVATFANALTANAVQNRQNLVKRAINVNAMPTVSALYARVVPVLKLNLNANVVTIAIVLTASVVLKLLKRVRTHH
jgi:uncharacterized membrane protein